MNVCNLEGIGILLLIGLGYLWKTSQIKALILKESLWNPHSYREG